MPSLAKRITPPGYVVASILVSLGGILNGFDTGSIGAVTEMGSFLRTMGHLSPTMRGFTVSLIMLAGAAPSLVAGQLADRFGRLEVVMAGAIVFTAGAVLQAAAGQLPMFLVGRTLCGLGQGMWLSNVCVYITEIAPSLRRGALVAGPQFGAAAGVCIGFFTCWGTVRLPSSMAWRAPFIIQGAISLVFAACCLVLPTSPRWLVLQGKRDQAMREIERLNISRAEAEKDILNAQHEALTTPSLLEGLRMLFRRPYRSRALMGGFLLFFIQASGVDGILYYAPTLLTQAGMQSQTATFLASGVSSVLMLLISIPAVLLSDRMGRRKSVIGGGCVMSSCMITIGTLYASSSVHAQGAARWFVVLLIFTFALTYCFTWGVVGRIYASEIQPARTRAAASCVAQGLSFFSNWIVAFATPVFLSRSAYGAYFLFGFLTLGTVAVLASFMPETRGRSLEDIQSAFHARPMVRSWAHSLRRLASRAGARMSERSTTDSFEMRGAAGAGPTLGTPGSVGLVGAGVGFDGRA